MLVFPIFWKRYYLSKSFIQIVWLGSLREIKMPLIAEQKLSVIHNILPKYNTQNAA